MPTDDRPFLAQTLLLHLLPGAAIVIFYVIAAPRFVRGGFPRTAALLAGFVIIGMPLQLTILRGKSIRFREPMPVWQFLALVIVLFGVALAIVFFVPLTPLSDYLASRFF